MASLRKKYQGQLESPRDTDAPVMSPPTAEPPPAVEPKPIEPVVESSPAEEAAQNALRKRLKEMENAEALQRQQQQPQHAAEPEAPQQPQEPTLEQVIANLPPRVQRWYRAHPEFLTDPEKAAQIQYCHHVARRETGEEMTEPYFDRMEVMLGLRQRTQPNGNGRTESAPAPAPARPVTVDRPPPQPPVQAEGRRMSVPVSAPPTREAPSMRTGRPVSYRAPLTRDELEIAAASGQTPEQYQQQKEKMLRMKQAGELQ